VHDEDAHDNNLKVEIGSHVFEGEDRMSVHNSALVTSRSGKTMVGRAGRRVIRERGVHKVRHAPWGGRDPSKYDSL